MVIDMNKKLTGVIFFSIIMLVIDQAIKMYLSETMVFNQTTVLVKDFLNITLVKNTGAAFSILNDNTLLLIGIGIFATIGIILYVSKMVELNDLDVFTYSLLLGGVLGNLVDRIFRGYVVDYISLNIFGYHFPIFNFADICIVGSVILIFMSMVKGDLWKE